MLSVETREQTVKRCTKCVLPETFPGIHFDDKGVCNYCLNWDSIRVSGPDELEKLLSQYRGQGKEFDCIVPLSGGRDSTYVLYQIATQYKMRAMALTVDSGFILPEGIQNIENVTKTLQIPHVWLRDTKKIKVATRNVALKFRGWLEKPSINTVVPVLNAGDKTMNLQMYNYAHKHGIPLVIGGNNVGNSSFEQENWKTGFMGVFPNERGFYSTRDKIRLMYLFAGEFLSRSYNYHWSILSEYLTGIFVYFFESSLKPKDVRSVGFYDYILWNEKEVVSAVTNHCNWQGASDATTTWRIDDSAYPIINYIYYRLVGFTEHDEHYSRLIRERQITRDVALRRLESDHNSPWIHGSRLVDLLKEMNLTRGQLDESLDNYRDKLMPVVSENKNNSKYVAE